MEGVERRLKYTIRAVMLFLMLCMSKVSKEAQVLCMLKHVKGVKGTLYNIYIHLLLLMSKVAKEIKTHIID